MKLVSAICPSKRSLADLQRTIDKFLAQTYPCKELVILRSDASMFTELAENILSDPHRLVAIAKSGSFINSGIVPPGLSIGELRNIACRLARGSVIAHWDDDDLSHPARLARSMAAIDAGASLVGSSRVIYEQKCGPRERHWCNHGKDIAKPIPGGGWESSSDDWPKDVPHRWLFDGAALKPKYLVGGTMVYRRELWERRNFEDVAMGEDSKFYYHWFKEFEGYTTELRSGKIIDLAQEHLYTARISDDATSPKDTQTPGWSVIE